MPRFATGVPTTILGHHKRQDAVETQPLIKSTFRTHESTPWKHKAKDGKSRNLTWKRAVSAQLLHLTQIQEEFFDLVRSGAVSQTESFLQDNPAIQVNCEDHHGHTALDTAVIAEDLPMITYLQQRSDINLGDSLLHAVKSGNVHSVRLLLDRTRRHHLYSLAESTFSPKDNSAHFTPDITPLILAAHHNHYEIIRLLIDRGHVIHKLHPPDCFCDEQCQTRLLGESLSDSLSRYNMYRALASPSYICQSTSDPIYAAFMLSDELQGCAGVEREFKAEYMNLADSVTKYAVELLAQCCTTEEVVAVLSNPYGMESNHKIKYPRLTLAMQLDQKAFVAHPNCQQVLRCAWLEGWHDWRSLSFASKLSRLLPRIFLLPIIAMMYWAAPRSHIVEKWKSPMNKFFSFAASYALFLIILLIQIGLDHDNPYRSPPMTGLEPVIIIFVTGFMWRSIKMLWLYGPKQFFKQYWNIYEMVLILFFYLAFTCWLISLLDTFIHGDLNIPRYKWKQYDPVLIGEVFYAYATILAFGKLMFFFQIGQGLGPLQVTISYMLADILKFAVVFCIVLLSFSVGIHMLYHHYQDEQKLVGDSTITQDPAFTSYRMTFRSLFWAIYGYSPPNFADVIVRDYYITRGNKTVLVNNSHFFTQAMGMSLYAIYSIAGILVLINMLIAMMSTSFANVQGDADMEWKFARTRVWLTFFEEGQTLPPPFNLIPTPKSIVKLVSWLSRAITCDSNAKCSVQKCCYVDDQDAKEADLLDHNVVLANLVQRYMNNKGRSWMEASHTEKSNGIQLEMQDLQNKIHNLASKASLASL